MIDYQLEFYTDAGFNRERFASLTLAVERAELQHEATLVKFIGHPNGPGLLPKTVWQSCAMWVWENQTWFWVGLFDGWGHRYEMNHRPGQGEWMP